MEYVKYIMIFLGGVITVVLIVAFILDKFGPAIKSFLIKSLMAFGNIFYGFMNLVVGIMIIGSLILFIRWLLGIK